MSVEVEGVALDQGPVRRVEGFLVVARRRDHTGLVGERVDQVKLALEGVRCRAQCRVIDLDTVQGQVRLLRGGVLAQCRRDLCIGQACARDRVRVTRRILLGQVEPDVLEVTYGPGMTGLCYRPRSISVICHG